MLLQVGVTTLPTSPSSPSLRPLPGASLHLLLTGRSQHQCRRQATTHAPDGGCGEQPPGGGTLHGAVRWLCLQQGAGWSWREAGPGGGRTTGGSPHGRQAKGSPAPLPQEEDGSTCLHHAAKIGNLEMVSLLLSTGQVDVNAQVSGLAALPMHGFLGCPSGFAPRSFLS